MAVGPASSKGGFLRTGTGASSARGGNSCQGSTSREPFGRTVRRYATSRPVIGSAAGPQTTLKAVPRPTGPTSVILIPMGEMNPSSPTHEAYRSRSSRDQTSSWAAAVPGRGTAMSATATRIRTNSLYPVAQLEDQGICDRIPRRPQAWAAE
jgi:hypothetical protein